MADDNENEDDDDDEDNENEDEDDDDDDDDEDDDSDSDTDAWHPGVAREICQARQGAADLQPASLKEQRKLRKKFVNKRIFQKEADPFNVAFLHDGPWFNKEVALPTPEDMTQDFLKNSLSVCLFFQATICVCAFVFVSVPIREMAVGRPLW